MITFKKKSLMVGCGCVLGLLMMGQVVAGNLNCDYDAQDNYIPCMGLFLYSDNSNTDDLTFSITQGDSASDAVDCWDILIQSGDKPYFTHSPDNSKCTGTNQGLWVTSTAGAMIECLTDEEDGGQHLGDLGVGSEGNEVSVEAHATLAVVGATSTLVCKLGSDPTKVK